MIVLACLVLICVVWAIVTAFLIVNDLEKRGIRVSYVWLRLMILKYLHQYATITKEQTGRVGPLFYHYVVPLNIALVLAIIITIVAMI